MIAPRGCSGLHHPLRRLRASLSAQCEVRVPLCDFPKLTPSPSSRDVASLPAYLVYINGRPPLPVLTAKPIVAPSTLVLYATSMDPTITNDACEPLNPALKLAGRVVLVQRGGCDFVDKLTNVAATGARYALIYNKPNGGEMPYFDTLGTDLTAVGSLRREDGLKVSLTANASRGVEC